MVQKNRSLTDLPAVVPVFPLAGALLLPRAVLPLNIFEPRYLAMIDHVLGGERIIGMVQPKIGPDGTPDESRVPELATVGTLGRITHFEEEDDGRYLVGLTGLTRFRIVEEATAITPFRQVRIDPEPFAADLEEGLGETEVDRGAFERTLRAYAEYASYEIDWDGIEDMGLEELVNACVMASPYGPRERQALLEADTLAGRVEMLTALAEMEMGQAMQGTRLQ